jgi:hypothetical protein
VPPVPQNLGASGVALLSLALVCWLACLLFIFSVAGKQVHGDAALGQAYAFILGSVCAALTWLWLGGLLLKAGVEGVLPAGGIVLLLYLASALAAAAAVFLVTDNSTGAWPASILVLLPALMMVYVFALYQPSLRPLFSSPRASVVMAGLVLLISAAPFPAAIPRLFGNRTNRAAVQQEIDAHTRDENLRKLQAMPADAPLWDWFDLLYEQSGVRAEAIEAVRHLDRRQSDMEEALGYDVPMAIRLIPDLDLQPTPRLCEAAGNYLRKTAKETRVRPKQDPREYGGTWVAESLPALRWLMSHGCDCDATIAAMEASVSTFIDTPARNATLSQLAELRKQK